MDKLFCEYSSDSEDDSEPKIVDTFEGRKSSNRSQQEGSAAKKSEDNGGIIDMDMSEDSNQDEKPSGSQQQPKKVSKDVEDKNAKKRPESSSRRSSNEVKIYDDEFQKERDRRDKHSRRSDKRDDHRKDRNKEHHHKSSRKSKSRKEKKRRHRSRSRSRSKSRSKDRESRDSRTSKDRRSRKRSHSSSTPPPPVASVSKELRPEDSSVRNLNNIVIPSHPPPSMPNYQSRLISAKANIKVQQLEKMGIDILGGAKKADPATIDQIPAYYNKNVINVNKYAEQMEKRKLLWGGKKNEEVKTQAKWENTKFSQDNDGKVASKFMRLMGIKDGAKPTAEPSTSSTGGKSTEELFTNMEQQYEKARQVTHTMRGVGLGFGSHARQY